jgi:hypothetical protein
MSPAIWADLLPALVPLQSVYNENERKHAFDGHNTRKARRNDVRTTFAEVDPSAASDRLSDEGELAAE